jgi:hypothetical protein
VSAAGSYTSVAGTSPPLPTPPTAYTSPPTTVTPRAPLAVGMLARGVQASVAGSQALTSATGAPVTVS